MVRIGISITEAAASSSDVRWCFEQYYDELDRRFRTGFAVVEALPLGLEELTPPRGLVLLAHREGSPVGCGALKLDVAEIAEIKRMWVSPEVRGQGLGSRLLSALEERAIDRGKTFTRLETNASLGEAIAMYQARGYVEVPPFNDEKHADFWFRKDLHVSHGD